jgi:predicted O-linked N-acetylglucosamine transferase (SPINDLY family)
MLELSLLMNKPKQTVNIDQAIDLALQHHQAGRLRQAEAIYRNVLQAQPNHPDALHLLGMVAHQIGNNEAAIALISKAIRANAFAPAYYSNIGGAYLALKRYDEAHASYRKALSLKPDFAEVHNNLGMVFRELGKDNKALASFRKAVSLKPDYAEARWAVTMAQLPAICTPESTPDKCRSGFSRELGKLERWLKTNRVLQPSKLVGSQQPFFLAYQEKNNRELLSRYGTLCARLIADWQKAQRLAPRKNAGGGKIRVGIVSAHIQDHSVWNALVKGWFQNLDRNRFELLVFHVGEKHDAETARVQAQATFFAQGKKDIRQWAEIILEQQPDVLIYPEIGMDPTTVRLASLRLAPVQAASWGHPETTGLPTMDYYLSAEDLEPPNAQNNYTEQLVLLPHLGCSYAQLPVAGSEPDFGKTGIKPDLPVFLCPGTPFKYAPEHDRIFVEIAQKTGPCQFVFFNHHIPVYSAKLRRRLQTAFSKAGMNVNTYVLFIPWLDRPDFYSLMKRADVFLDTIGFSGFNTIMQAVECGLPFVTREGRFMRGRLASGILRRMDLPELITHNEDDYIELATKLAMSPQYREDVQRRILEKRPALFDDPAPVRALEDFLTRVTKAS